MDRGARGLPYALLAGVVPTADGWLVACAKHHGPVFAPEPPRLLASFSAVLDERPPFAVIALDAPIGDGEPGARACDVEARELLGLTGADPGEAEAGRVVAADPALERHHGEVASEMAPYRQRVVFEALPELSFFQLNGGQRLQAGPRSAAGLAEREALLRWSLPGAEQILEAELVTERWRLLDAAACLWTARRIAGRMALRLPADPEWGSSGLRQEIVC